MIRMWPKKSPDAKCGDAADVAEASASGLSEGRMTRYTKGGSLDSRFATAFGSNGSPAANKERERKQTEGG